MKQLNDTNLDLNTMIEIQKDLSTQINLSSEKIAFQTVAGVDLAYWTEETVEYAVCCIVVLEQGTMKVLESKYTFGKVEVPYIPDCLAFRELPLILETVRKLEIQPDLYMFDGNGYLHPRHMGIATHASFYLNKPTIGVAKSYYKIENARYQEPHPTADPVSRYRNPPDAEDKERRKKSIETNSHHKRLTRSLQAPGCRNKKYKTERTKKHAGNQMPQLRRNICVRRIRLRTDSTADS